MFIYSKLRGTKVYHAETCGYCKNIKKENIGYFHSREEAQNNHYHACQHCSIVARLYKQQGPHVQVYCKQNDFRCEYVPVLDQIHITSPVDDWLIVHHGKKFEVYHRNYSYIDKGNSKIKGYHNQKWRFTSLLDTIKSVADHQISIMDKDNLPSCVKHYLFSKYMGKSPKGRKRKAKEAREQKKFNKRVAIRSVLDLIDQLHCSSNSDVNGNYDSAYSM